MILLLSIIVGILLIASLPLSKHPACWVEVVLEGQEGGVAQVLRCVKHRLHAQTFDGTGWTRARIIVPPTVLPMLDELCYLYKVDYHD